MGYVRMASIETPQAGRTPTERQVFFDQRSQTFIVEGRADTRPPTIPKTCHGCGAPVQTPVCSYCKGSQ